MIIRSLATSGLLLLVPVCAGADDVAATLRGVAGVKLVVDVDVEVERALPSGTVRRDTETFLAQRGIALLAETSWSVAPGRPVLRLEVESEPGPDGTLVYSVTLELEQDVRLQRDASITASAPTWSGPQKLGVMKRQDATPVREAVRELLESFAAAYTKANGKR